MRHLRYAKYLARHKWFVFLASIEVGVPLLGALHDLSKFRPSEWSAYANFFYGSRNMGACPVHPLGSVAGVAEDVKPSGESLPPQPGVESAMKGSTMFRPASVDVVNTKELPLPFTAPRAGRRITAVGNEDLLSESLVLSPVQDVPVVGVRFFASLRILSHAFLTPCTKSIGFGFASMKATVKRLGLHAAKADLVSFWGRRTRPAGHASPIGCSCNAIISRRGADGYYKPTDSGDAAFDFAWLLHQKRNRHHWQWYSLPEDNGGVKVLPMADRYRREMLADWWGAGRAQSGKRHRGWAQTREWYTANSHKMQLHPETRAWVESQLASRARGAPGLPCRN